MAESEHLVALSPAKNTKDLRSLLLEIARNQSTVSNRPRFLKAIRDLRMPFILSLFVFLQYYSFFPHFLFPFLPFALPLFRFFISSLHHCYAAALSMPYRLPYSPTVLVGDTRGSA